MARPLRIEFAGALYHITSKGDRREAICEDDEDRGTVREEARQYYQHFVLDGAGQSIWEGLRQQIYLGGEALVERMQAGAKINGDELTVPQAQRRLPAPSLADIAARHRGRNSAIVAAYTTGAYSYREIAEHFAVHLATVGRIVRTSMQRCENCPWLSEFRS